MRKLWEAAFAPQQQPTVGAGSEFAVLPQQEEHELTLSEVHSKLDRALNFLQRDVGYILLDDIRPRTGGGVRLQTEKRDNAAVPKGDGREPKEPLLRTSSSPHDSPEDLDDTIMKLLFLIFQRNGGKLRAAELVDEVNRRQLNNPRINGQLIRLFSGREIDPDQEITWKEFEAFHAESKAAPASGSTAPAPKGSQQSPPKAAAKPDGEEILVKISPDASRYAHYQCDLVLVSRFSHVLYKGILQDLIKDADAGLLTHVEAHKRCNQAVKHDGLCKSVLQACRLMHLCDYDYADVVLVLGYATVYFRSTFSSIGKKMSPNEAAHVVVLLIYLSHAFLLDETCPLRIWQKHIFRKYCTLKVLDAALFRLFQMRPSFKLRISDEEERHALMGLSGMGSSISTPRKTLESDREEASDAIKQMMGADFTHPKLLGSESKDMVAVGGASNGGPAVPRNGRKCANAAVHSGSSSGGSAGRSPPGSGQSAGNGCSPPGSGGSADRTAEAPRSVRSVQVPSAQAPRVSEATNMWSAGREQRENHQRRSDRYSQEPTYSANRSDQGSMPLARHAERSRPAAEVAK